jgi:hypothetical protein
MSTTENYRNEPKDIKKPLGGEIKEDKSLQLSHNI